ncbi:CG5644 [Drosophila busckii]|uniref:CG5644 n=1 Tax=Drosophila busckii TaxID=30019 RepID=A0A0M4E936_DROBS|nr:CG5644 [Drosophila busckii]
MATAATVAATATSTTAGPSNDAMAVAAVAGGNHFEEDIYHLRKLFQASNFLNFNIADIACSAGSSSGDNYMSLVKRVTIYETKRSERANSCSVIIKRQIASLSRRQLYRCEEAFSNEINAYRHVVPLLCRYAKEPLFPLCHLADAHDDSAHCEPIIVLQDLKALGYRMQNRLAGLELRHCLLVMKKLAQLHAASLAAQHLESSHFAVQCAQLSEIVYCPAAADFYSSILDTSMQQALDSLNASNADGNLSVPIRLMEQLQPTLFGNLQQSINAAADTPFSVVCHGDFWLNNLMFRSQPEEVIFFDLQAMRRTSPVFDILHFIYTSTRRQLRDVHTDTLLATYAEALRKELAQQLRHTTAAAQLSELCETFSLQRLSEEYVRHVHYGLAISMWILPAVTFDPLNLPNLDEISEDNLQGKEINCTQNLTPEYHLRIRELALEFYEHGYLDA